MRASCPFRGHVAGQWQPRCDVLPQIMTVPKPWATPGSHPRTRAEARFGPEGSRHVSVMPLLSSQDAGSQQIGFLLGSCGVTVALTSDACHKGLPKSPTGEIPQFKGRTA